MSDDPPPFGQTILREDALPPDAVGREALQAGEGALPDNALTPAALSPTLNTGLAETYDAKWIERPATLKADPGYSTPGHLDLMANVLCVHNVWLPDLARLRAGFDAKMKASQSFRDTIAQLWHHARNPGLAANATGGVGGNALAQRLGLASGGTPFARRNGDARAYDPWDGWWSGVFDSNGTKYLNYHVWDPTVVVTSNPALCSRETESTAPGYRQHVQMVTQTGALQTAAGAKAKDPAFWYPAANFMRNGFHPLNRVDYAVNVWSATDHLTGYVIKEQNGNREELPHIAYLMDDETLLWITFVQPFGARLGGGTERKTGIIFAEHGARKKAPATYHIRGMLVDLVWDGAAKTFTFGAHSQVSVHRGDYTLATKARHAHAPKPAKLAPQLRKPLGPP